MNTRLRLTAALVVGLLLPAAAAFAQSREDAKLIAAAQVLQDLHSQADQRIAPAVLLALTETLRICARLNDFGPPACLSTRSLSVTLSSAP